MKTIPVALAAHIATRNTTIATAIKITRVDGQVYAYTSHDQSAVIDGVTYSATPGFIPTAIETAAKLAVGNLEMRTLHDESVFTTADILGRVWTHARFEIFRYNWDSISDGIDTLLSGNFGEVEIKLNEIVIELRDIRQYMQQPVGEVTSKTCRARLGDARCKVSLAPITVTGTITHVTSNQVFRDSARAEAADYFGEGEFTFTSGANAGHKQKVKVHAADGTFTLLFSMSAPVVIGDGYSVIAGCRRRLTEDCETKFNNVINFRGEPHSRGPNNVMAGGI